jgi:hypothetical protein
MTFFSDHLSFTVALWAVMYISDYALTRITAGWYQAGVRQHIEYERGIELTPIHQRDIAMLRWISPRFLLLLIASSLALWWFGALASTTGNPAMFEILIGAWLLVEAAVLMRHLRNLTTFYFMKNSRGVRGSIYYEMWLSYRVSAVDGLSFGLLYLALYFLTGQPFFLGGILSSAGLGVYHWLLSIREQRRKMRELSQGSST